MSVDMTYVVEVKVSENDAWTEILKIDKNFDLGIDYDRFLPYIFMGQIISGWYDTEHIVPIHDKFNGQPNNLNPHIDWFDDIRGYLSSNDIDNYIWDFKIKFEVITSKENANAIGNGTMKYNDVSYVSDGVNVKFEQDFRTEYALFLNQIEHLKTHYNDYRILCVYI
jgi:hypothetical protein